MYVQESLGTTLLEVQQGNEYRRVFVCEHGKDVEIGELTYGDLTYEVYGLPAHYHCVRLGPDEARRAASAFCQRVRAEEGESLGFCQQVSAVGGEALVVCQQIIETKGLDLFDMLEHYFADKMRFLADLLDDFDAWGVKYGYMDTGSDGRVTYRPPRHFKAKNRPIFMFVA